MLVVGLMRRAPRSLTPRAVLVVTVVLAWSAAGRARAQTAPPAEPPPASAPPPATTPPAPPPPPSDAGPSAAPPVAAPPPSPAPPVAAPPPGYVPPAYAPPYYYYAYPPPAYATPPPAAQTPAATVSLATPPPGSTRSPAEDPQADRGVVSPTAYTHPKGTYYFSDYEIAFLQFGYAFTDDTQLTFTGVPPLGDERIFLLDLTLKTSLYRGGRVRIAALGSTSGIVAKEVGVIGVGRVGGVAQFCLERRCDSSLSLSSNVTLAGVLLMVNGATGILRASRLMSVLAELDTLVPLGQDVGQLNGGLAAGGVRLHWVNWGLDLTLVHVLGSSAVTFPLVALTYRSVP